MVKDFYLSFSMDLKRGDAIIEYRLSKRLEKCRDDTVVIDDDVISDTLLGTIGCEANPREIVKKGNTTTMIYDAEPFFDAFEKLDLD